MGIEKNCTDLAQPEHVSNSRHHWRKCSRYARHRADWRGSSGGLRAGSGDDLPEPKGWTSPDVET